MSKDKAGKKDKLKRLDLFELMLNQSQVFRDMVEQFQSAWVPRTPSAVIERSPAKKQAKANKAAPAAKPAKTHAAKKPAASAKPVPTAVKPSPPKSPGKAKAVLSRSKLATPRKNAGKAVAASRPAKEK